MIRYLETRPIEKLYERSSLDCNCILWNREHGLFSDAIKADTDCSMDRLILNRVKLAQNEVTY